jgi:hypothetical protein
VPRLLAAALRRVWDPDSSVRAPLAALAPLTDAVLHEHDQCAQLAAAAAAGASEPTDDFAAYLRGSSRASTSSSASCCMQIAGL